MNETVLQRKLLKMLDFFHCYCKKEGLRYYIIGGTALGSARHEGFIPWDDDIDVGMPRSDYEKFKILNKDKDIGDYHFEYVGNEKDFVYPFGKMYDTTTTLVENTRYKTKRGIYIDIFPIDGVGNTYDESINNFKRVNRLVNLLSTKVCGIRKGRKFIKNACVFCMRYVPSFIVNTRKLMISIDEESKRISFDDSIYVANLVGNWYEREIIKKEWLGEPTECNFSDIKVMRPENIDEYLTAIYGDWKTLPPKEKQVSHHDFVSFDLYSSYR